MLLRLNKLKWLFKELSLRFKFNRIYLLFQKYGVNIIKTVNSSSLPRSIKKDDHHLASNGNSKKVFVGPNIPIDGPTFPRLDAETPSADSKSRPKNAKTIVPIMKDSMYTIKKPSIL